MSFLTRDRVREVDRRAVEELSISSLVLMENAARGLLQVVQESNKTGRILVLCGSGNNGGDGLALRRLLAAVGRTADCGLVAAGRELTPDASANLRILQRSGIDVPSWNVEQAIPRIEALSDQDVIVDAMLGTGVRGTIRSPFDHLIGAVNASSAAVISADVPSGMDCDTGLPCGVCVAADQTVTFVAAKAGFQNAAARRFTGAVTVCHIGIPDGWLREQFPELTAEAGRDTTDG